MTNQDGMDFDASPFNGACLVQAFIAMLWLGILLGVSFLATPVKFQASTLTLPVALEVGRVTFAALTRVEWLLLVLLFLGTCLRPSHQGVRILMAALALLVLLQAAWLLPALDARVDAIMQGADLTPSSHHILYVMAEIAKGFLLLALSVDGLRTLKGGKEAGR